MQINNEKENKQTKNSEVSLQEDMMDTFQN